MKSTQKHNLFVIAFFFVLSSNLFAAKAPTFNVPALTNEGNLVTAEGAWCWFADPRSLHYRNDSGTIDNTYIAYIDSHGSIKATQHNFLTGKTNEVLIRSAFQPDDHDVPTFLVLPDERIMIFYSRHTDEARFYYRISKKPGDITQLGDEKIITTSNNTTYPNPFILSDDPTHIYLCWRGINWHPTIAKLSIPDAQDNVTVTDGPYQIVQSTGARPYAKYFSNGKDKIYLTYTTGHPDNEYPNWVYYNYIDIKTFQLKDLNGTVLSTVPNGVHNVTKSSAYQTSYPKAVVDAPTTWRDWVWQTSLDKNGKPVIAMVQISNGKTTHMYYYAKWTGTEWRKTLITNGGGQFHQTPGVEMCYSGGMAIDDANPNIVYCSVPKTGTYGKVYEIVKYTIDSLGVLKDSTQITYNSKLNNMRPFVVFNSENTPLRLTWMHGNYYYWLANSTYPKGYPTDVRSEWTLPGDSIQLTKGLLVNENFDSTITGTAKTNLGSLIATKTTYAQISAQATDSFSISLTPYIYASDYSGNLLTFGNLTYGLNGTSVKPFVTINGITYSSSNVLGTSDSYWSQSALSGVWTQPTKLKFFNLTLTYKNGTLKIFRNGLIDQVIDGLNLQLSDLKIGGFNGWVEDCNVYSRALNQDEIKKLNEVSQAYLFNSGLVTDIEFASINIPSDIYSDVILPSQSSAGIAISWTSSNTTVLPVTGLVNFPLSATPVKLTATLNGLSKTFDVTVFPRKIINNELLAYTFNSEDVFTSGGIKYIKDKSGKNNDAIVYGNAIVNGSLDLSANTATGFSSNGYAKVPDSILYNVRSYSILAKIKPAALASAPRIYDFGCNSGNSMFLRASAFTAGYKYNGGTTALINSAKTLTVGQESTVAVTFDAKTKMTRIYLNGVKTDSSTAVIYEPYQITRVAANTRNYIGRTQWWDSGVAASNIDYSGTIDDFYFFDIVLTQKEIQLMQSNQFTEIKTVGENNLQLYPNPIDRNTRISLKGDLLNLKSGNISIEVFNINGDKIYSKQSAQLPRDVDGISQSGIYFLRILSENQSIYDSKLIVK